MLSNQILSLGYKPYNSSTKNVIPLKVAQQADDLHKMDDYQRFTQHSIEHYERIFGHETPESVKLPNVMDEVNLHFDIFMIGDTHLLFMPKEGSYNSLNEFHEVKENKVVKSVEEVINVLQKMYPDRNIYFFEHGSGKNAIRNINRKEVLSAHGHFIIPPQNTQPLHDEIIKQIHKTLTPDLGWKRPNEDPNALLGINKRNSSIREIFEIIASNTGNNREKAYLLFSTITPDNSISFNFIPKDCNEQKTISQIFRRVLSKFFKGVDNTDCYDWKKLVTDNSFSLTQEQRIMEHKAGINDFLFRLDKITNKVKQVHFRGRKVLDLTA